MTTLLVHEQMYRPFTLALPELSDDEFLDFCAENSEHRIERTAEGVIVIMSGTGARTGKRNALLTAQLVTWALRDGSGDAYDSSTLFRLPNTAMRSPDASWVSHSRLVAFGERDQERILPLCPEFVVELTSPSDHLAQVCKKMEEWMANGCQLGWILHVSKREVHVYRGRGIEILRGVSEVRGEGPLEGFALDLTLIWDPGRQIAS